MDAADPTESTPEPDPAEPVEHRTDPVEHRTDPVEHPSEETPTAVPSVATVSTPSEAGTDPDASAAPTATPTTVAPTSLTGEVTHEADAIEADLAAVDRALERLEASTYGRCVVCSVVIDDALLAADPTLETCPAHVVLDASTPSPGASAPAAPTATATGEHARSPESEVRDAPTSEALAD